MPRSAGQEVVVQRDQRIYGGVSCTKIGPGFDVVNISGIHSTVCRDKDAMADTETSSVNLSEK